MWVLFLFLGLSIDIGFNVCYILRIHIVIKLLLRENFRFKIVSVF